MATAPEPDIDLGGKLSHFSLSDIFQMLSLSSQTGVLELRQGWNRRTIHFKNGRISFISQGTNLPRLGELLIRSGKITEDQLLETLQIQQETHDRLGNILIRFGLISKEDLRRCVDQQLEETIYSMFLWRECTFIFKHGEEDKESMQAGIMIDLPSERVIMEGIRRIDEWITINKLVPSLRLIFCPTRKSADKIKDLPEIHQKVFKALDGNKDIVAVAESCGLTKFETSKCIYDLIAAGLTVSVPPNKTLIIEVFSLILQTMYKKLTLFGYARMAQELEQQLVLFSRQHKLKTRLFNGKVVLTDADLPLDGTTLVDLYKLFISVQINHFSKILPHDVAKGLLSNLYSHVDPEIQKMLHLYNFYPEGYLLDYQLID